MNAKFAYIYKHAVCKVDFKRPFWPRKTPWKLLSEISFAGLHLPLTKVSFLFQFSLISFLKHSCASPHSFFSPWTLTVLKPARTIPGKTQRITVCATHTHTQKKPDKKKRFCLSCKKKKGNGTLRMKQEVATLKLSRCRYIWDNCQITKYTYIFS